MGTFSAFFLSKIHEAKSLISGGVRGILELCVLKRIEEVVGVPIQELFDIAIGTSTGKLDDSVDVVLSQSLTYPKAVLSHSVCSNDNGPLRPHYMNLND